MRPESWDLDGSSGLVTFEGLVLRCPMMMAL
jgi:hypothetical protein